MSTTINITNRQAEPVRVDVLRCVGYGRFLSLHLPCDVTVILPGFDEAAVTFAESIREALANACVELAATAAAETEAA